MLLSCPPPPWWESTPPSQTALLLTNLITATITAVFITIEMKACQESTAEWRDRGDQNAAAKPARTDRKHQR